MKRPRIAVIGGDERSKRLAEKLARNGFDVGATALDGAPVEALTPEQAMEREVLILPVPVTRDGDTLNIPLSEDKIPLRTFFAGLPVGSLLLGGGMSEEFCRQAEYQGCRVLDYAAGDAVARANAIPTAEGAAALAMENSPITLHGSRCLVIGSGRCGRALARLLKGMGAKVSLSSRKKRHTLWALLHGYRPVRTERLDALADEYDFLFNTVPVQVVTAGVLERMNREALLIELATGAAGVDREAAERLGRRVLVAPGLPGKVAPETAAEILYRSVHGMLTEEFPWISYE